MSELPTTNEKWMLKPDSCLFDWQLRAVSSFPYDNHGVARIVTGAGKTLFAIALLIRHQNLCVNGFVALIVVPTKMLQTQWVHEIIRWTNIDISEIGLIGNGQNDDVDGKHVLIAVVNSAIKKLDDIDGIVKKGNKVFLVLDECHRYTSQRFSQIIRLDYYAVLGLSATPHGASFGPLEIVGEHRRIGDLFFEFSYDEAIDAHCLSDFEVIHVGFDLSDEMQAKYDLISREIEKCRHQSNAMLQHVSRRWMELYQDPERDDYAIGIILDILKRSPKSRIIAFHERIACIDRLAKSLKSSGVTVTTVHSKLSDDENRRHVEAFATGSVNVVVAGKALMEGFDVPSADVGLIISATTSPRRAIQTFGRVLRRNGNHKSATIYRLYARGTVEEKIFSRTDFDSTMGAGRNRFCTCCKIDGKVAMRSSECENGSGTIWEGELRWEALEIGAVVKCRPSGFHLAMTAGGDFSVVCDGGRYKVVNGEDLREVFSRLLGLRFGIWYFCTNDRHILERNSIISKNYDYWRYCGDLPSRFVVKVVSTYESEGANQRECHSYEDSLSCD